MARILYVTTGLTGMTHAGLELAARLRARGHEVAFASHRDRSAEVVAAGFAFTHLTHGEELRAAFDAASSRPERREIRRRSLDDTELEDLVDGVRPDLLVIDIEMHVAVTVTRRSGIPTVIATPFFSILHSPTNPPLHTSLTPDDGVRVRLAWLVLWAKRLRHPLVDRARRLLRREVPPPIDHSCRTRLDLAQLARRRGWPYRRHTTVFEWLHPHTYTDLPILSSTAQEMEFAPVADPRLHHVGPMVPGSPPPPGSDRTPDDERWREFLAARDPSRPLVYCAQGSMWKGGRALLEDVVEVFRRRPDRDLVVGLGGREEAGSFRDVPANVLLLGWAPQVDVLRHAAAAIVHGGIGTVNECVVSGVPMVAYSHGSLDADGNVARVVHHGLGVTGDGYADGPEGIEAALRDVLGDDDYRTRCERMAGVVDRYRTSAAAEQLVESFLDPSGVSGGGP